MTTRNQWIADRVAVATDRGARPEPVIGDAKRAADAMEASGCAPWQTPPPAPTPSVEAEAVAKVVKSAVKWCADLDAFVEADVAVMEGRLPYGGSDEADRRRESSETALVHEVRAYLARLDANGGAK